MSDMPTASSSCPKAAAPSANGRRLCGGLGVVLVVASLGLCSLRSAAAQPANPPATEIEPPPAPLDLKPTATHQSAQTAPSRDPADPSRPADAATPAPVPPAPPGSEASALSAPDIGGLPLMRLLDVQPNWSGLGSFKLQLPKLGISSYLHGIGQLAFVAQSQDDPAQLRFELPGRPSTFEGDFAVFVGAEMRNVIFAEAQIVLEAVGGPVNVNFAQVDVRVFRDFLFIRGGKFLVPMGGINVYPDPPFSFKLPELPLFYTHVMPDKWGEVGVQLYGRYSWAEGRALSYTFYVANGLEQKDGMDGGDIGDMANNLLDEFDNDKAVGGQIQLEPVPGLSFGISGYTGIYTQTNDRRLSIGDFHFGWKYKKLTVRAEVAAAFQETQDELLVKLGTYGLLSYRVIPQLEPVFMVDWLTQDDDPIEDRLSTTLGLVIYPYPQKVPTAALRLSYAVGWDGDQAFAGHRFAALAIVGF